VTRITVQILRQATQVEQLPLVEAPIPLRVVTNQGLAEARVNGFNLLVELIAVFEVEFVLSAFLGGTTP